MFFDSGFFLWDFKKLSQPVPGLGSPPGRCSLKNFDPAGSLLLEVGFFWKEMPNPPTSVFFYEKRRFSSGSPKQQRCIVFKVIPGGDGFQPQKSGNPSCNKNQCTTLGFAKSFGRKLPFFVGHL